MSKDKSRVEKSLTNKGFILTETHHHYYVYYTQDGKKTTVKTKTSHTKKMKVIPDNLLSQMAKQCHLNKSDFLALIECPLSQEEYENKLYEKGILKTDKNEEN